MPRGLPSNLQRNASVMQSKKSKKAEEEEEELLPQGKYSMMQYAKDYFRQVSRFYCHSLRNS